MTKNKGGWVIDLDIRKFFDTLDHGKLREILAKRIGDGVIRKLIDKWLKAGVMEYGEVTYSDEGTPQGGVISPLLSNIYLHEVLDEWFVNDVQPRVKSKSFIVRFADDAVLGFENKRDAERKKEALRSLDFCITGGNLERVTGSLGEKTDKSRLARAILKVTEWIRKNRHQPIGEQQKKLKQKMMGHYGYYGITGNSKSMGMYQWAVQTSWHKWLNRRSCLNSLTWAKFYECLNRFPLPQPRIVHSYI